MAADVADAARRDTALLDETHNVHLVGPNTITFLDRRIPGWFRVTFDGSHPTIQHMTAAAHFMTDRYVGFDVSAEVSPPSR